MRTNSLNVGFIFIFLWLFFVFGTICVNALVECCAPGPNSCDTFCDTYYGPTSTASCTYSPSCSTDTGSRCYCTAPVDTSECSGGYPWGPWGKCELDVSGLTQNCYKTRYCTNPSNYSQMQIQQCDCDSGNGGRPMECPDGTIKTRVFSCRTGPGGGWQGSNGCDPECPEGKVCVSKLACKCPEGKKMEIYNPPFGCIQGTSCPEGYTKWNYYSSLCTFLLGSRYNQYSSCFRCVNETGPVPDLKVSLVDGEGSDGPIFVPTPATYILYWRVRGSDAVECTASGSPGRGDWVGRKDVNGGTQTFAFVMEKGQKKYTLKCTNQYGEGEDSVIVNVGVHPPIVDIKAKGSNGPVDLIAPASYTVSWTSTDADSCSASGTAPNWSGSKNPNGNNPYLNVGSGSYTYTITCTNEDGYASDSVTVNVSGVSPSPSPSATPEPGITRFEITNFRLQETSGGVKYYQVLKEQMGINHPNYQLNLVWTASEADTCTASCKYVTVDDYLANQDFDELTAQPWPCARDINNDQTFYGSVDPESGMAKTKPKEAGVIRYRLRCQSGEDSDTADLLVVIQDFKWFETIPILNFKVPGVWLANISNWFNNLKKFEVGLAD